MNRYVKYSKAFLLDAGSKAMSRLFLRRSVHQPLFIAALLSVCMEFVSCEKDFDININPNTPQLVVEAYINNLEPTYNYVVLSRSLDYFSTAFQSAAVTNATVTITEGERVNDTYQWNPGSKVNLIEANLPIVPPNFRSGVYFDPKLVTDSVNALKGKVGKSYLLEITEGGSKYSAITNLLTPVRLDSITAGYSFIDEDDNNKKKLRATLHYKDPDTLNNTQLFYLRFSENRNEFGWGATFRSRALGADDLSNGQYIRLTPSRGFLVGDTVNYQMASVTRDVFTFWQSFNSARNNNGPFATPVTLKSNMIGNNVTGCFSGLSLSSKTVIMR
jgi:hypothetical protein